MVKREIENRTSALVSQYFKMNKFFQLLCLCFIVLLPASQAQVTNAHVWVNEFRYDNMSNFQVDDQDDFVELIVSNELLNSPELANYRLVFYAVGGFDMDTENGLPGRGLPYSKQSLLYSDTQTFHSLADEDLTGENGFQRCPSATGNYTVLTKKVELMDIPSAFGLVYENGDNSDVIQLISYERAFNIKDHPDAGPAAGQSTTLLTSLLGMNIGGTVEQDPSTRAVHSIQLLGTGATYDDFSWNDDQNNTQSLCTANVGQTINELPCIPPSIHNPGNQTACNVFNLPAIEGQFVSADAAYFNDSQENGGTEITGSITSDMTVWIFDDNGCGTSEESFDVTFESGVTIPDFSDVAVCKDKGVTVEFAENVPAQSTIRWQKLENGIFTDIPNQSTATLNLPRITADGTYRLVIDTETGCSGISNQFMILANEFEAGTYNGEQEITRGENAIPFAVLTPAAGDNITYQWESGAVNNNFEYSDIANATDATYDPGTPQETTFYRRITTNQLLNSNCSTTGDAVRVKVNPFQDALGVTLQTLEAFARGENNVVAWKTAMEFNAKGFQVEWSVDGKNFEFIGFVTANNRPSNYTFTHETPEMGDNYYRLQELDNTGKTTQSPTVNVLRTDLAVTELTVTPNPATETVVLNLPTTIDATESYELTIFNSNGQVVVARTLTATATLSVSSLATGMYQVVAQQGEQRFETQLVKVK